MVLAAFGSAAFAAGGAEEAKKLYVAKCAKCHKLYDPAGYGDEQWAGWMEKMRRKARLSPEQYDLLLRYLASLREKRS